MRKHKRLFTSLMLLLSLLCINLNAYAFTSYNDTGSSRSKFIGGSSLFNLNLDVPLIPASGLSDGKMHALVADLDNDGVNEIIVQDGNTIKIFHGKDLTPIDSYTFDSSSFYSNLIAYDIDKDNLTELIIARNSQKDILIISYNGTFSNQTSIYFNKPTQHAGDYTDGETLIKCGTFNNCLLAYTSEISGGSGKFVTMAAFNSSDMGQINDVFSQGGTTCFPQIKEMQYDTFGVNTPYYVFSAITIRFSGTDAIADIFKVQVSSNLSFANNETFKEINLGFAPFGFVATFDCSASNAGQYITSPLLMQAVAGGFNEAIIGLARSTSTFEMLAFDSTATQINDHPFTFVADGKIISNPMKINAFPVSNKNSLGFGNDKKTDYCVLGFKDTNRVYDLLCGSSYGYSLGGLDTIEYFSPPIAFNISTDYQSYNIMAHSWEADSEFVVDSPVNMDEILTSNGVFKLYPTEHFPIQNCSVIGFLNDFCMLNIFPIGEDSAVIPVDAEKTGHEDIIGITPANLFYIDDGFSNSAPVLCPQAGECTISPCIDTVWKINQTVSVKIKATDVDGEKVAYRLIGYKDTDNQQDSGFGANVTSGVSYTLSFFANQSISSGILELQSTDFFDNTHIVTRDVPFSVQPNGITASECTSSLAGSTLPNGTVISISVEPTLQADNAITTNIDSIAVAFGLTRLIIWIILMVIVAIGVLYVAIEYSAIHINSILTIIGIVEGLMLILGTLLGFVSIGIIITIVVISIVIIGFQLRRHTTGSA